MWSLLFFFNSTFLGVGLAMDAFSVSMANGLNEPQMSKGKMSIVAGAFAVFQFAMPLIGWFCVHTIAEYFKRFQAWIPWIALLLLLYIGIHMLLEGIQNKEEDIVLGVDWKTLMIQGIATSIDALSVGFTIAEYHLGAALLCAFIIGVVTFIICLVGLLIGKKFGTKFAGKATILGGLILIGIGIEIFVKGI